MNSTEHPVKVGLSDAFMALIPASQLSGQFFKGSFEYFEVGFYRKAANNQ